MIYTTKKDYLDYCLNHSRFNLNPTIAMYRNEPGSKEYYWLGNKHLPIELSQKELDQNNFPWELEALKSKSSFFPSVIMKQYIRKDSPFYGLLKLQDECSYFWKNLHFKLSLIPWKLRLYKDWLLQDDSK